MLKVGITGGIGSGKTTCSRLFAMYGIPVYDSDSRAKLLMNEDAALRQEITKLFGTESYGKDGRLNRGVLAKAVFSNKDLLEKLNALVHPAVHNDGEKWYAEHADAPYVLKEAALIYEVGIDKKLDKVIVVSAPDEIRIERVMKRSGSTAEEVKKRIASQMPQALKIEKSDFHIENDGMKSIIHQVAQIHRELMTFYPKCPS